MVKEGFYETPIGLLPTGWNIATLGSVAKGKLTYGLNAPATAYIDSLPQYIRITDITEEGHYSKAERASVSIEPDEKYWLQEGDIVLARTGASTGKSYLYNPQDGRMVYAGFLIKASVDSERYVPKFIAAQLRTARYWRWVEKTSLRSGQPGINGQEYSSYLLPIPDYKEQQAIATALSDVDELIVNLEKLIEKKKAIKQGTMQDLLNGKKRLPGFNDEWKEHSLSDYAECIRGVSYDGSRDVFQSENDNTIRLLRSNNIQGAQFVNRDIQYVRRSRASEKQLIRQGDIMVCMANGSKSLVGKSCYFGRDMHGLYSFGAFMSVVRLFNIEDGAKYIFYLMNSDMYWKNIALLLSGSSINNLRPGDILGMLFKFPDKDERNAITKVLDDMENEIVDLENKLAKYCQIKHGMMQKLLTGEIRLV